MEKCYYGPVPNFIHQLWIQFYWARTVFWYQDDCVEANVLTRARCLIDFLPYLPNLHRMPVHWSVPWKHKSRFRSSLSWRRFRTEVGAIPLKTLDSSHCWSWVSAWRSYGNTFFWERVLFPLPPAVENRDLTTIVEQELGNSLPHDVPTPSQDRKSVV